jgi:hypothetical protein
MRNAVRALLCAILLATGLGVAPAAQAVNIGNEGCTPGYWKTHTDNWEEARTTTIVGDRFNVPDRYAVDDWTFLRALQGGGGPGVDGAARILARAAVAAYLNAAHEGLGYPLRRGGEDGIIEMVNEAFASGDRQTMLDLAAYLDSLNNLGCPLN